MREDECVCKVTKRCEYGYTLGGGALCICGYILETGEARSLKPQGEIINGRCGLFKERTTRRKRSEMWL